MVHWLLPHLTISFAPNAQELSPLLPVPPLPYHPSSHHSCSPDEADGT